MVRRLGGAGLGRREASPFAVVSCSAYDSSAGIEEIEHSRAGLLRNSIKTSEFGELVDENKSIFCVGKGLGDEILNVGV